MKWATKQRLGDLSHRKSSASSLPQAPTEMARSLFCQMLWPQRIAPRQINIIFERVKRAIVRLRFMGLNNALSPGTAGLFFLLVPSVTLSHWCLGWWHGSVSLWFLTVTSAFWVSVVLNSTCGRFLSDTLSSVSPCTLENEGPEWGKDVSERGCTQLAVQVALSACHLWFLATLFQPVGWKEEISGRIT